MYLLEPEEEFILLCSRLELDIKRKHRLKELLRSPLKWGDIFKMASINKVTLLIFKHLYEKDLIHLLSDTIKNELSQFYYGNLARNLILFKELKKFLKEFENARIPTIILKGGYLSHILYDDPGLRMMGDIDILFEQEDFYKVKMIAEKLGYSFLKSPKSKEIYEKYHFHYVFIKYDNFKIVFEFHWNLVKQSMKININPDNLWENCIEFELFDFKAKALSYENQFLHLIIHSSHDCFEHGLISLCEIAEFYKKFKDKINIPKFVDLSYKTGANKLAYYALYQIEKLYDIKFKDNLVWQFKTHPITSYFLKNCFDLKIILHGDVNNNLGIIYFARLFLFINPIDSINLFLRIIIPNEEYLIELYQINSNKIGFRKRFKVLLLGLKLYSAIIKQGFKTQKDHKINKSFQYND